MSSTSLSSPSFDLLLQAIKALAESTAQLQHVLTVDPISASFLVPVSPSDSSPALAHQQQYTPYELEFFQMHGHLPVSTSSLPTFQSQDATPDMTSGEGSNNKMDRQTDCVSNTLP